jgi:HlyD family secretion protein
MAGYFVIVLMFGIVGGWSTIATLDQAVEAPGVVTVEAGRQSVSHLEDGIIEQILVKEGQHVDKGQVLFRLSPIQALAQFDLAQNQLDADLILEARLLAERDQLPTIKLPEVIASRASEPAIARIIDDQTTQFNDRTASVQGQVNVLNARIQQVQREIDGLKIEKDSTEKQVGYIRYELVGLRELLDKRLVPLDRVLSMERERTRLEGLIGKSITDQAKAEGLIGETRLQIAQLKQKFQEETAAAILEARQKITDLRQKEAVAKDILHRVDIRAAQTGKLQGSRVTTVGQIIRSAEQLAEIVPDSDSLLVRVQFSPNDIDNIHEGQEAEIRFPSFNLRTVPIIMGRLQTVSTDRLLDDANNKQPYYLGLVAVSKMEVPPELEKRLKAGMPAEVIVASGERSVLSYFISPLRDSMRKAFIEK